MLTHSYLLHLHFTDLVINVTAALENWLFHKGALLHFVLSQIRQKLPLIWWMPLWWVWSERTRIHGHSHVSVDNETHLIYSKTAILLTVFESVYLKVLGICKMYFSQKGSQIPLGSPLAKHWGVAENLDYLSTLLIINHDFASCHLVYRWRNCSGLACECKASTRPVAPDGPLLGELRGREVTCKKELWMVMLIPPERVFKKSSGKEWSRSSTE